MSCDDVMSPQIPGSVTPPPSAPSQLVLMWISSVCPSTGHLDLHMWSQYLSSQKASPPWPLTSRLGLRLWIRGASYILQDPLTNSKTSMVPCPLPPLLPLGWPRWRPAAWGTYRTRGTIRTSNPASMTCWAASHVSTIFDLLCRLVLVVRIRGTGVISWQHHTF